MMCGFHSRPIFAPAIFIVIVRLLFFMVGSQAACLPPASVQCESDGCQIFNYQGIWDRRATCRASRAVWPEAEAELLHAVAHAVKAGQKIKVVSSLVHSESKVACAESPGLIISTENYASIIAINNTAMTITVQAGAMMIDVTEEAAKAGLALPAMIYWNGVSAAGVVSTGSHGSGLAGRGSGVYEYVVAIRLIVPASPSEGYAKIITLTEADEELKAARLSLGTLGAISEITFALEPLFKRSVHAAVKDDDNLENEAENFLRASEFADIVWVPSHHKAVFRTIDRVGVDVPGDGVFVQFGTPARAVHIEASASHYETIQADEDVDAICNVLEERTIGAVANGFGFFNDGEIFTGYPVVGFNHRMQASGGCQGSRTIAALANDTGISNDGEIFTAYPVVGSGHRMQASGGCQSSHNVGAICTPTEITDKSETVCQWDRRVYHNFIFVVSLRVPVSRLGEAIKDVKRLRDLNPRKLCDNGGLVLRSIKKSEAYLGPAEDVVTLEMMSYRPREAGRPKWNEDVHEELEQMVIEKHGGSLHWGKNGGYLFDGLHRKAVNFEAFLKVKERFDPLGVFSSGWTDALLGIGDAGVEEVRDWCALDKLCKCSEDSHCASERGYVCQPGKVWKNARVCRKVR